MSNGVSNVQALLAALRAGEASAPEAELSKTAEAPASDPMEKLAEELGTAGHIMADSFVDQVIARFKKQAEALPSSHAAGAAVTESGGWQGVAKKITKLKAKPAANGDAGHIRAEDRYKNLAKSVPAQAPKN
jgi:hypothetical protein